MPYHADAGKKGEVLHQIPFLTDTVLLLLELRFLSVSKLGK